MQSQTNQLRLILPIALMLLLAACTVPAGQVPPTPVPAAASATESTAEPTADSIPIATSSCAPAVFPTQSFTDEDKGFCFHLPEGYTAQRFAPGASLTLYAPESTPGHRERGFVELELAVGRTADTAADAVVAGLPGFTPTRSAAVLGNLPAVVLDGLPGQDIQRKVFAVADDRLFTLTFVPASADQPEAFAEMETLYALILATFNALPPTSPLAVVEQPALVWQGDIQGACHTLQITAAGEAAAGLCDDAPTVTATLSPGNGEWDAVLTHFGAIDAHTYFGRVLLAGNGDATGQLWGEALATWASFTAQEMIAGRTSASARTVVAWQLAELADRPGQCRHLIVLAYGYAYANVMPCGGGQAEQVATGWLTDDELATLTTWRMEHGRVDDAAGYVDTLGTAPLAADAVTAWAAAVYDRLAQ